MAIAGTNIPLNSTEGEDKITTTDKVTSTYLSDSATQLLATSITTQSLSDSNETYYYGIANSSTPTVAEFNIAYGNYNGKGGNSNSDKIKSPTEVIYKQWASLLLPPTEVTGGFFISRNNSTSAVPTEARVSSGKDNEIYVLSTRRTLMKDRLNKKNWTLALSGSHVVPLSGTLVLTDDSVNDAATATPVGDRYNIVSGSDGTVHTEASVRTFGFVYPDIGVMIFSGTELSASIPGTSGAPINQVTAFNSSSHKGFGTTSNEDKDYKNALRFVNCLTGSSNNNVGKLKFRNEEDQVSAQYFCRIKSGHCNFSNNPTFVSGSLNELRHTTMKGNPTTYITQVQLYNTNGDMVAVGNLSTPLKKNFSSEATVKVKLTY
jgi:hypothetical protein